MENIIIYTNSFMKILCEEHIDTPATILFRQSPQDPTTKSYQDRVHPRVDPAETHQRGKHHSHHQPQNKGILQGEERKQGHWIMLRRTQFDAIEGNRIAGPVTASLHLAHPRSAF